jgi:hypothetical protein
MKLFTLNQIMTLSDEMGAMEGKPTWANLYPTKLAPQSEEMANDLAGGGVYACFWKNELIYIGKFVHKEGNPLGGHVFTRIGKHAAGFLQRDRRLFFRKKPFEAILRMDGEIAEDLRDADWDAMVETKASNDSRGKEVCSTKNKVIWAQRDWDFIKSASPSDIIEHFTFGYRRVTPPPVIDTRSKKFIDQWVGNIEKNIISDLNPPCNKQYMDYKETFSGIQYITETFERHFVNINFLP